MFSLLDVPRVAATSASSYLVLLIFRVCGQLEGQTCTKRILLDQGEFQPRCAGWDIPQDGAQKYRHVAVYMGRRTQAQVTTQPW